MSTELVTKAKMRSLGVAYASEHNARHYHYDPACRSYDHAVGIAIAKGRNVHSVVVFPVAEVKARRLLPCLTCVGEERSN